MNVHLAKSEAVLGTTHHCTTGVIVKVKDHGTVAVLYCVCLSILKWSIMNMDQSFQLTRLSNNLVA